MSGFLMVTGALAVLAVVGGLGFGLRRSPEDPFRVPFKALGYTGCVGLLAAAYLVWNVEASVVIRGGIGLILVGAAGAPLGYPAGRASMVPFGMLVAGFLGVVILQLVVGALLHAIPFVEENLKDTMYSPSNLRMAVFAVSLVIVMLVRPQGLMGHHEFSWSFLSRTLGMKTKETSIHS